MCIRDSLKGTPDLCVRYSEGFTLHGYFYASHSDDLNNSRPVSGYLYLFVGGPVAWSSKKQLVVALSSCESEYIPLTYASQESPYLSDLLSELTFPQFSSVQMHEDNMGALQLSGTTASSSRTKHICTRCQISARAGCIEQDHRISCQDNRSVGRHLLQILGLLEV